MAKRLIGCLVAAIWLAAAAQAHGAAWLGTETLSEPGFAAQNPQAAVNPSGDTWIVWQRDFPDSGSTAPRVQAVRVAADGTVGPVRTLSDLGGQFPKVAVDPAGRATVIWTRFDGTHTLLEGVRIQPDASVGTVHVFNPGSDAGENDTAVGVDSSGNATVIWDDGTGPSIRARRLDATDTLAAGVVQLSGTLAASDDVEEPEAAVGGDDVVQVAWTRFVNSAVEPCRVEFRRIDATGSPEGSVDTISDLGDAGFCSDQEVTADAAGNATIEWNMTSSDTHHDFIGITRIPAGAAFTAGDKDVLSDPAVDSDFPQLAPLDSGALAVWALPSAPTKASFVPNGSAPGSVLDVSDDLVFDAAGDHTRAALIFDHNDGSNQRARAAFLSTTGALSEVQDLSPPGVDADTDPGQMRMVFGPDRTGLAVWLVPMEADGTLGGSTNAVQVRFYDEIPPAIAGVAAAPAALVGQQLELGTAATDRSGVASYAWSFGDGASASTQFASHTYSAPGTYTVTLTVTDGVGNAATQTRTVVVTAPSAGSSGSGGGGGGGATEPPAPQIKLRAAALRVRRTGIFTIVLGAQPAAALGRVSVTARTTAARALRVASGQFIALANQRTAVRLKLSKAGRRLLGRKGRLTVRAALSLEGLTGKTAKSTQTLVLRGANSRR
jgi:hypothetical protein